MSLFPDEMDALALGDLDAVRGHYGLGDRAWSAVHEQLGYPDMRILAAFPGETLVQNILHVRLQDGSQLTPAQAVQVGLVWRLCRRITWTRGGQPYNDWVDEDPWAQKAPAPAPVAPGPMGPQGLKEKGIKMSSIIDQSDDTEFTSESLATTDRWFQRYVMVMGAPPQEEEDCTVEQLSALHKRIVTLEMAPYVDLAVWLPYGRRALRANKFRAWLPDGSGAYISKELPGPANWTQWVASWRVFQTAAIMLDVLPLASLQLYERHIEKLTRLYPSAWHLIVLADEKARGEKWSRIRIKVVSDVAAGRAPPDRWDPLKPWIACLHLLVGDHSFWEDQVRSPANAWIASGGRGALKTPAETFAQDNLAGGVSAIEPIVDTISPGKKTNKERRQAKKRKWQAEKEELKNLRSAAAHQSSSPTAKGGGKGDSLKSKDQAGRELCYSWDAARGTCAECGTADPCKARVKRAHKCRLCLSPGHRSGDCPQKS